MTRHWFIACICLCLALSACNKQGGMSAGPTPLAENGMLELRDVYKYIRDSKLKVPKSLANLEEYEASLPVAFPKIQSGDYVVIWGAGLSGGANVLAYEKDAAGKGGLVLLQNEEVKTVTADEFAKMPRAK